MKRPIYFLVALSVLVCILFAACGQPAATPTQAPAASTSGAPATSKAPAGETPVSGGTLKSIHSLMLSNLGYVPDHSEPLDGWIAQTALETLLRTMPDGSLGPFLATSYTIAPDMKSVTFNLRKGVKFHDGTDFNAQAVKFNIELYNKGILPELKSIASIDIIDDHTVKMNFSKVEVGFMLPFAGRPTHMQSPTALQSNPKEWFLTHLVGTGPFKWESYTRDISLKYSKFPGYYQQGKPYLDGVEFMFIADMTTATMALKANEGHSLLYPSGKDFADLKASGFNLRPTGGPIFTVLMDGGNASSPYSNLKVRQAVAHAIDGEAICKGLGYGMWEAVNQWAWKDHWSYNKEVKGYPYDPAKAKQLLTEGGFPNGFKTTLFGSGDTAELVQKYFKAVGIDLTIEPGTMAGFSEKRQKGWNNGIMIAPVAGPPMYKDSKIGLGIFASTSGSYPNIFHNKEIDDLITQANQELDFTKRDALNRKLNKIMVDDYCANVPLWHHVAVRAENPKVKGWDFVIDGAGTWAPENAWLAK